MLCGEQKEGTLSDCVATWLRYPSTTRRPRGGRGRYSLSSGGLVQSRGRNRFLSAALHVQNKTRTSSWLQFERLSKAIQLETDLVITSTDVQHQLAAELIKAGVTVWAMNVRSIEEIYDAIRNLGQLVRRSPQAEQLIIRMERDLQPVERHHDHRPRVYFEEWPEPLITGIGWVSELIERAGGNDIFAELRREKKSSGRVITPEEVLAREPEIIFASWCGKPVLTGGNHLTPRDGIRFRPYEMASYL